MGRHDFGFGIIGRWFAKGQFCKQTCTVRSGDLKLGRCAWEGSEQSFPPFFHGCNVVRSFQVRFFMLLLSP